MLNVSQVSKRYGKNLVNNDLSFTLADKQLSVLLGPNGSGKSTIIKCIVGFLRYEGDITLDGKPIHDLDVKRQIAYVPEVPELYNELTVWQHFQFIAYAYGITNFEQDAEHYLTLFQLHTKKDDLCGSLSKGMRQKVSIICALILNPRVLIVDEPMIGLDPDAIRELKNIFLTLKETCAILVSTHLIDSITNIWDQVLILNQGKLVYTSTKDEFEQSHQSLEDIYFSHHNSCSDSKGVDEDETI
ncbi:MULTISPECIES: ABC transporter ATP-binding protein [unclassified Granulicatella]|uniref:ABC transporter ATP-binding protein n=1 Tax=unclassified Granulicatella TaxID=2630493 RepID=UPI001073B812|nr:MULTISPECIES: ABC transporter ATP-binding protein [unclassified Granulicatella]MBF0779755.1 ABC transporter ATP-binding protein [Granulicatella sp. 19428wC4_WM01]TFU96158.1 ABC transporter ATP-binding protein [Granulicatella sp. WM01]